MNRSYHQVLTTIAGSILAAVVAVGMVSGCTTPKPSPKTSKEPKYVFFPPAPDDPHVQYLTGFSTERDLRNQSQANFMTFLTGQQPVNRSIGKPYGGFAGHGKIYVCDSDLGSIVELDLVGRRMGEVKPDAVGSIQAPLNMAVDTNGWIYLVDMKRQQLVILDASENFLAMVGEKGKSRPMDVALTRDRIYLSDLDDHCVHVLDKTTRTNLFDIPRPEDATNIQRKLFQPINIALDGRGRLIVSDLGASRVQIYDADGKYIRSFGEHGNNLGDFTRNKGVATDQNNYIYVVDAAFQNVQMFNDEGRLLMAFGGPKSGKATMQLPAKVLIDYDDVPLFQKYAAPGFKVEHLIIVLNQFGSNKVAIYGFGHKV